MLDSAVLIHPSYFHNPSIPAPGPRKEDWILTCWRPTPPHQCKCGESLRETFYLSSNSNYFFAIAKM